MVNGISEGHEKAECETQEKSSADTGATSGDRKERKEKEEEEKKESLIPQEYGFTVKIQPPTGDVFEIQVCALFYYPILYILNLVWLVCCFQSFNSFTMVFMEIFSIASFY